LLLVLLHYRTLIFTNSAWTNKLITAKDHASVQLNIGHLNDEGSYTGAFTTFALAGRVRAQVRDDNEGGVVGADGGGGVVVAGKRGGRLQQLGLRLQLRGEKMARQR
jgi:hypothetical protein